MVGPIRLPESIRVPQRIRRYTPVVRPRGRSQRMDYPMMRVDERLVVEAPGGWGPVAPAPGNAIVALVGKRLRRLPGYGFFGAGATTGATTGVAARPIISAYLPLRSRMRAAYDELRMILSNCPR